VILIRKEKKRNLGEKNVRSRDERARMDTVFRDRGERKQTAVRDMAGETPSK
jgi:hypothetical protein